MDFKSIKKQAIQIYNKRRDIIIPEFFYIGYVSLLAQYLQSGFFSFFVSLFLCPIAHGYVVCAQKLVDEPDEPIVYTDSLVGVLEFIRVAPAYLMRKASVLLGTAFMIIPVVILGGYEIPAISLDWIASLGNAFIQTEFFLPNAEIIAYLQNPTVIVLSTMLGGCVYLLLSSLFALTPYIIEEDEYSWSEALELSVKMMKPNLINYIKLYLHFIMNHFIYWLITGLFILIISPLHEIVSLICFVGSLFVYIDLFKGRFEIAKYLFYKEIRVQKLFEY